MNANSNDNDKDNDIAGENAAGENAAGGATGAANGAENSFDAEARLRAADPAAGLEPSAGFVDDVLARTLGASADSTAAPEPAPVHDLTAERARRRPRWLPIAAVAASIAIVGGAAFGLGSATGGNLMAGGPLAPGGGAAPPISLQSGTGAGAMSPQGEGMASGISGLPTPEPMNMGSAGDRMSMPWGFSRNNFSSSGLSTKTGSAAGFGYDARSASTPERVAALAAALGVEGTPELKDGAWLVGPQDGTAPTVYVSLDGTLSFNFNNPAISPWQCAEPAADGMCPMPTSLPSEQAAIDALRGIVTAAGLDADAFEFTSDTWEGSIYTRTAQAWPVVDGQRVGQAWYLEMMDAGVFSVSGSLATLVPLGEYAIVSEQDAFKRLSDPRFGAQMTAMPIAMREQTVTDTGEWVAPTEPPATPSAGAAVAWPVTDVKIVSARLGLTSQWQPDGSVLVVPAYEFTDADGGTWSVIAVDDSMLDFAGN
ncbi:hypothetical protein [Microterricola viridarii]|nr:hypothetical protein [Microterricola viridarii]